MSMEIFLCFGLCLSRSLCFNLLWWYLQYPQYLTLSASDPCSSHNNPANWAHVTWKACLQPCLLQVIQAPVAALLSLPWSSQI